MAATVRHPGFESRSFLFIPFSPGVSGVSVVSVVSGVSVCVEVSDYRMSSTIAIIKQDQFQDTHTQTPTMTAYSVSPQLQVKHSVPNKKLESTS